MMSTHMCLELMVLMMLFHNIFDVLISAVLVVSYPGCSMRFMPEVILTQLGSVSCGH